jgi:hypothetical protein
MLTMSVAWGLRNIMLFQPCSILTDITKSKSSDDLAKLVLNRSQLTLGQKRVTTDNTKPNFGKERIADGLISCFLLAYKVACKAFIKNMGAL